MNKDMVSNSLAIVVPCYNEEEAFPITVDVLNKLLLDLIDKQKISKQSYLLFVDDGSKDKTWSLIQAASETKEHVQGLKLSRNAGHQFALVAGLSNTDTDMVISIDADLQDDITVIEQMIDQYLVGYDVVYGARKSRSSDTYFKRNMALAFYKLMDCLGVEQVHNHADFRLLSRRALSALLGFQEENLYLRGLVPLVGFKSTTIYYDRLTRVAGDTKYPFFKSLALAIGGITSLSIKPLRLITMTGFIVFCLAIFAGTYVLIEKLLGNTILGWSSVIITISFFGGLQMLALGIIGEYIGRIYYEVKKRPKFIVEEVCGKFYKK